MKRKATTTIMTLLFLAMMAAIAIPVSAHPTPPTVEITFLVDFTVYSPQGDPIGSDSVTVTEEFVKSGKAYHTQTMWAIIPWLFPSDITGSPVVISPTGKFDCWLKFTSHWPDTLGLPSLPLVQMFWGELTIIEDTTTMTGTYFDRGYCISEDYPVAFDPPGPADPEQIGNSDIWYLGYTEYNVISLP